MLPGTGNQTHGDARAHLSPVRESPCGPGQASPLLQASVSTVVFKIPSSSVILKHRGPQTSEEAQGMGRSFWSWVLGGEAGRAVQSLTLKTSNPG